jgi:hypothetical protein
MPASIIILFVLVEPNYLGFYKAPDWSKSSKVLRWVVSVVSFVVFVCLVTVLF